MRVIIALFTVVLFASCKQPERDCKSFKTGTFTYETTLNGETVTGKFIRTEDLQIEYFKGNKVDSSAINWVNDCEYVAKKLNPESMREKKPILFKILVTEGNTYTFEYSYVGDVKGKSKGKVTKIN